MYQRLKAYWRILGYSVLNYAPAVSLDHAHLEGNKKTLKTYYHVLLHRVREIQTFKNSKSLSDNYA